MPLIPPGDGEGSNPSFRTLIETDLAVPGYYNGGLSNDQRLNFMVVGIRPGSEPKRIEVRSTNPITQTANLPNPVRNNSTLSIDVDETDPQTPITVLQVCLANPVCVPTTSEWSNDITYSDVYLPNGAGNISVLPLGDASSLNLGVSLTTNTNIFSFFDDLSQQISSDRLFALESRVSPNNPDAAQIRLSGLSDFREPHVFQDISVSKWPDGPLQDNRAYEWAQGTMAETELNLINFFAEIPEFGSCRFDDPSPQE